MNQVVSIARSWVGTKFHHQGRKKGIGVDCIGLIAGVAMELGLAFEDRTNYAREPRDNLLMKELEKYLTECELQPGCVALFKIENEPQHVGIISDYNESELGLIHAYIQARKVVEHNLDELWKSRLVKAYKLGQ